MRWRRIELGPGFLFFWALFFFWDREGDALWAFLACAIHEAGHWAALRLGGGQVRLLRLTILGASIIPESRGGLSYGKELMATLAGPGLNLLLALLFSMAGGYWQTFSAFHLLFGLFNLLPLPGLDGGRAVALLHRALKNEKNEKK